MLWNDLRYALRLLRRDAGFTTVAVLSLAFGIGANTAIFSLVNTVLLRPLPVAHAEQLVELLQQYPGEPRGNGYYSPENFEHFRQGNHVFSEMTGTSFDNIARVQKPGAEAEALVREDVKGNYFSFLGLQPAIGRFTGPDDLPAGGDSNVVVVSWSYWNRHFQRDPAVLGQKILINDTPKTIVGVAPRAYVGPRVGARTEVWQPCAPCSSSILARLKPGVTLAQANAEIAVLFRPIVEQRMARSQDPKVRLWKMEIEPAASGFSRVRDQYGKPLILLMGVVGMLLLLACINMASLLLARGARRHREIAVRVGLGASRGRLLRQMLTESLLLSGMGTLAGVLLAYFGVEALVRIMASGREFERIEIQVQPDLRLLGFTIAIAVLTGILFGLAPAWHALRTAPAGSLRQSGRGGETRFWRWFGKGLVAAQVGLSILLLTGAAAFLDHVSRLRNLDLGFRSDHVLLMQLDPARSGYQRPLLAQYYRELLTRLEAIPGVRSASATGCSPIQGCGASRFITAEGVVERPEDRRYTAISWVAPRYFETMGIPLISGRDFAPGDVALRRVTVVSQAMAKHFYPAGDVIGKYLTIDRDARATGWLADGQPYQIIGIAGDAKAAELREAAPRTIYFNMFQDDRVMHQFILRTSVNPASVAGSARRTVKDLLKVVPVTKTITLADQVDGALVPERMIATLSEFFSIVGATLAGVGLFGLLAYTVARRTNEIGVRMALGATPSRVSRLVLADALATVLIGALSGAALVVWCRPLASQLLPDLQPGGLGPMAWGSGAIFAIALLATYVPVRRAARVDPMVALRHE